MRIFEHPNITTGWECPICGTDEDKPVVLIRISGTEKEGFMKAEQFHLECIELYYYKENNLLAMKVKDTK